ncbi:hypothetical protein [Streptomyces sp. NPDC005181]
MRGYVQQGAITWVRQYATSLPHGRTVRGRLIVLPIVAEILIALFVHLQS